MQITPQTIDAIYYSFLTLYQGAYDSQETWHQKCCSTVPSNGRENRYAWMDKLPVMREWIGERVIQNAIARGVTIPNRDFELTVELDRNEILDDQIGVYSLTVPGIGTQAKLWPDYLCADTLQAGKTAAQSAFDGQPFFSASHPINLEDTAAGTYSNLYTTKPLTAQNYNDVRATMLGYLGRDGKTLNVRPSMLIVPPQLEQAARQILNADFIAPSAAMGQNAGSVVQTNTLKGSAELLVVPQLSNEGNVWYLCDCTKPIKPCVFQIRKAPEFIPYVSPSDPELFRRKKFVYGVDSRGNIGLSLPFLMARAEG
jgi:phage major head subunit gpT-like protein